MEFIKLKGQSLRRCFLRLIFLVSPVAIVNANIGLWEDVGGFSMGEMCLDFSRGSWFCTERGCDAPFQSKSAKHTKYKKGKYFIQLEYDDFHLHNCKQLPGVAIILHEPDNIAHESRDALFLTKCILKYNVRFILGKEVFHFNNFVDFHGKTRLHYEGLIRALARSTTTHTITPFFSQGDIRTETKQYGNCVCFQNGLQKYLKYGNNPLSQHLVSRSVELYRTAVLRACSISYRRPNYTLLLSREGVNVTRAWEPTALSKLEGVLFEEFGLPVIRYTPGFDSSFCHQVGMFANALLLVGHHGAEIGGNSIFTHPDAVVMEITSSYKIDSGMGFHKPHGFFSVVDIKYVSTAAAFSNSRSECTVTYFRNPSCRLSLNFTRIMSALMEARAALSTALGLVPREVQSKFTNEAEQHGEIPK